MNAKVIKAYTDKNTGEVRLVGDEVDLTADRLGELSSLGHVEPTEQAPRKRARRAPKKEG